VTEERRGVSAGRCRRCGAELGRGARYCARCGSPTGEQARQIERAHREVVSKSGRAVGTLALVYGGVLAAVVVSFAVAGRSERLHPAMLLPYALFALAGYFGVRVLGRGAWRESLAGKPRLRDLPLGVLGGLAMFAVGWLYSVALRRLTGASSEAEGASPPVSLLLVDAVILPSLVEEWICRGVLWTASRRVASVTVTIAITALLFAMMHGVAWTLLGVPSRFAGGLVLGWLRARTGGLGAPVAAHFLNNLLAVALMT
jgi:membrane protease YdiL (CAAX protease family)